MHTFIFFLLNVLIIAWAVALLEIIIEGDKGWGAGRQQSWYGRVVGQNSPFVQTLARIIGIPHFFSYLLTMYGLIIPAILVGEYFLLTKNIYLLLAIYFSILWVEDFSWFIFNWHFDSLRQLLKGPSGTIWWHRRWVKLYRQAYLPAAYFVGIALSALFFFLALPQK